MNVQTDTKPEDTVLKKLCSACKILIPVTLFPKNRTSRDGMDYSCKECRRAQAKYRRETYVRR